MAVGLFEAPWDKLAHIAYFAALGALLMVASGGRRARLVVAVLLLVAVADELLQAQLPGRHASVIDFAADFAGAAAGVLLVPWLRVRAGV